MPIGKELRKWLRDEVFEELIDMEVGNTASENIFSIKKDNLSEEKIYSEKSMDNLSEIIDLVNLVDRIVDEDNPIKVACISKLLGRI